MNNMNYGTIGMVNDYLLDQLNAVTEDPELTRAGVNVVKLSMKIKELEE